MSIGSFPIVRNQRFLQASLRADCRETACFVSDARRHSRLYASNKTITQIYFVLMKTKFYSGNIRPEKDIIFVFGSNPEGRHGAGAARIARLQFGAVYGRGEGLQGNAYAIPTKDLRVTANNGYRSISPEDIISSIQRMYRCAETMPDKKFMIAYRNTHARSLNGYTGIEMIEMFIKAGPIPENIYVSEEWVKTGLLD